MNSAIRDTMSAGADPITRRQIYFKTTVKTEQQAQIQLGKLIEKASDGRQPESAVTVAELMDEYAAIAEWDVSTRQTNEGFIRRTIKPALGHLKVREVRGPVLDKLYTRLKRCGDVACTGTPYTEHRSMPVLAVDPADPRPGWQQVRATLTAAIRSRALAPGDELGSITEVSALQHIGTGVYRQALEALAADGLIVTRHGTTSTVSGEPESQLPRRRRPVAGHDCARAGCRPHQCKPLQANTIRGIHGILSGAFAAAQRWDWVDRNPAESARPPAYTRKPVPATSPQDVAKVITEARARSAALGLYLWLVAVTGVRRGELCALQIRGLDLDRGLVHIAFNYVVRGGRRVRKDTKTHQDRWIAIDPATCALIRNYLYETGAVLGAVSIELPDDAYLFSNDPVHARPWNPDWASHQVADAATAAGIGLDIKGLRHYTASQLLAASFDLRNTAARLGHSGGGATTLKHYADPVSEVDRRAAAYLSQLTSGAASRGNARPVG
jgi:integrase